MRVLVTGITGFVGGHLAEALLAREGMHLYGLSRSARWPAEWAHLAGQVPLLACDLTDRAAVERVVAQVRPEWVFHLAGYAHVGQSFADVDAVWANNLDATRQLYEAILRWGGRPRILYVSSGHVYGTPAGPEVSFDEASPLQPTSPYAASKAAADLMSYQYSQSAGLHVVRARPLNHVGPRQAPHYAVANFARQLAAIEAGQQPPIVETGNLAACRELTDVRDVVQAYVLLLEHGQPGEVFNVGSGQAYSMHTVLDRLIALTRVPVEVRPQAELMRPVDAPVLRLNSSRLRAVTGWAPRWSLEQTLSDALDYWRTVFRSGDRQ
ncbi:MAG: GDP-mannose 4,6-dehydratase [Gemmataceae bacterium]|nr:GDP-mannose 4,6-dehydratase [Gemmataceae bacterium]MDW8263712.1 GDP-mannose 4,6-dehydratase [Gemmataceae bacterium]